MCVISKCVSQCLFISRRSGSCFPQLEQVYFMKTVWSPSATRIMESRTAARASVDNVIRKGVDYCLWYIAWCCLNALLVLKLFWQIGQSMTMSTCVSQCLRMSFFAGMVFPHVEQLQLPSPKFWLIIESSMRLSSKYKQCHL